MPQQEKKKTQKKRRAHRDATLTTGNTRRNLLRSAKEAERKAKRLLARSRAGKDIRGDLEARLQRLEKHANACRKQAGR